MQITFGVEARSTRSHRRPSPRVSPARLALLAIAILSCGPSGSEPTPSPERASSDTAPTDPRRFLSVDAKLQTFETLMADLEAKRHPSDGGGRAWLEADPILSSYPAGSRARLTVGFEAGPLGVDEGGFVILQPSPFWEWDPPQIRYPDAPGFTSVTTDAPGVELWPSDAAGAFLTVEIRGRALRPGEQLRFVYGDGAIGARVDRFAEDRSPLYIAVDGDGDGVRALVENGPVVDVSGRDAALLYVATASTAEPGDSVRVVVAALDADGNPSLVKEGGIIFVDLPAGAEIAQTLDLAGDYGGHRTLTLASLPAGTHRLEIRGTGDLAGLSARSNPLRVRPGIERILWGDLHGHSQLSDGTGTPDQYYRYARDIAGLDISALTDHDHWGMRPLDSDELAWQSIRACVERFNEPGRFITLLGYEWTNWLHGHRHVLYFDDAQSGGVLSSLDPLYQTPAELWDGLRGQKVLTFSHHSAGGPISTNWLYPPDPELEPVTEIVSVHGSSEAPDSPHPIYNPVPGNYVRDAVGAGYPLGFIGSGDSHDGHPGLVQLADPGGSGGLAAIQSETLTRAGILEALRARRVYATNGARILLRVSIDDQPMGTITRHEGFEPGDTQRLAIEVVGTAPIERIDLVRSGRTATVDGEQRLEIEILREIPRLLPGEYHYVRVVQVDGGAAWSSPIFAR